MKRTAATIGAASALLAGCATYHPLPLPTAPDLKHSVTELTVPVARLRLPGLPPHEFNAADGLDPVELATLAVINNPQLKAERKQAEVAHAQLFNAKLLPDPQLGLSYASTTTAETPATGPLTNEWNASLSEQINQLVSRGATISAERAALQQVNLQILWKEWQVAQQARQLFIEKRGNDRLLKIVVATRKAETKRLDNARQALAKHDVTLDTYGNDLAVLLNTRSQERGIRDQLNTIDHDLDRLLGLAPDTPLKLTGKIPATPPSAKAYRQAAQHLATRRPDLLALAAGYKSQDAAVRKAILEQFPSLSIGIDRARDNSDIYSTGFSVSLSLPFLNGNRGQIAIARATRKQLYADYQARLDEARGSADELWDSIRLMRAELDHLDQSLPELRKTAAAAKRAFAAGNFSAASFFNLQSTLLSSEAARENLVVNLGTSLVALQTMLGYPFLADTGNGS
ncbi:MAG TPA: TolC family protein [Gammaproteobacteria bacterium]|nr:TolC family protein [Gammaproteobacteria bacterium]